MKIHMVAVLARPKEKVANIKKASKKLEAFLVSIVQSYSVSNTLFMLLTASALLLKAACSSSFNL